MLSADCECAGVAGLEKTDVLGDPGLVSGLVDLAKGLRE